MLIPAELLMLRGQAITCWHHFRKSNDEGAAGQTTPHVATGAFPQPRVLLQTKTHTLLSLSTVEGAA